MARESNLTIEENRELKEFAVRFGMDSEEIDSYLKRNRTMPKNMKKLDIINIIADKKNMTYGEFVGTFL